MLPKIGDEIIVKIKDGKIVSTFAVSFDNKENVQILYANNVSGEYLCYVAPYVATSIKETFIISEHIIRAYSLKKVFLNHDALFVRRDYIDQLVPGPDGATCKKCDTFVQYAMGTDFICYSCRENPYPSWRNLPDLDDD